MTAVVSEVMRIWDARGGRRGDRAFTVYAIIAVVVVVVAPLVRAAWLGLTGAEGVVALTSPAVPTSIGVVVAAVWAGALVLGGIRGPAVLAPTPTWSLATSSVSRASAFRRPLVIAAVTLLCLGSGCAALVGGALVVAGAATVGSAAVFVAAAAAASVIALMCWLAGQALADAAIPAAFGMMLVAAIAALVELLQPWAPWGWVAAALRAGDPMPALVAIAALAAGLAAVAPVLLARLETAALVDQSRRWADATRRSTQLDLAAAVTTYRRRPVLGRRLRAVHPGSSWFAVAVIRDAVGAARTPGRLLAGVLAIAGAGVVLAAAHGDRSWLVGAFASLVLFAGLGAVTDGLRHAADAVGDLPLYGVGDGTLMLGHVIFPTAVASIVLLVAIAGTTLTAGTGASILVAVSLMLSMIMARVWTALKGPLPPAMLTPVPTAFGDLAAAVRAVWAFDAVVVAAVAGAVAVSSPPVALAVIPAAVAALVVWRWRRRRG